MIALNSTAPYTEHLQSLSSRSLWLLRADYRQKVHVGFCGILQPNYERLIAAIDAIVAHRRNNIP